MRKRHSAHEANAMITTTTTPTTTTTSSSTTTTTTTRTATPTTSTPDAQTHATTMATHLSASATHAAATPPPPAEASASKTTTTTGATPTTSTVPLTAVHATIGVRPKPGILRLDINRPRRCSTASYDARRAYTPPTAGSSGGGGGAGGGTAVTTPHQQLSVTWAIEPPVNELHVPSVKRKPMQSHAEATTTTAPIAPTTPTIATTATTAQAATLNEQQQQHKRKNSHDFLSTSHSETHDLSLPLQQQQHDTTALSYCNEENDHIEANVDIDANNELHIPDFNDGDNNKIDNADNDVDDDEEDYSLSVTAIMQRRASVRGYRGKRGSRSSRRASSPMEQALENAERRRSSVYTTSSAEEGTNQESTQEQIFENIRLHKEVLQSVKLQPWPIRKKLKLVRQAKTYIARHEGALQERFAMSRSTKDLWVRFKILMAARWRHWKREMASFLTVLIPWELRIKEIESHFGSGVASFFTFLRWLLWVNLMMSIPLVAFVIGPEYFATRHDEIDPRKRMTEQEYKVAGNLFTIWEFEGFLKYSPMFYGYYSSISGATSLGYKLPLAYFLTALVVYIYSFVATLRKMAENSRNSKLSSKDDECTFSWKLFTGWDFMIGHAETAHNRIASVVVGFKEALLEEAEKKKDNRNWRIIIQRVLVNIFITALLGASGYSVVILVNEADELAVKYDNWLSRNAVNVTMTLISFFLPMMFEALGILENWHPRQQLRLQLARIMILNLLNLYSLMFSFIYKINSKEKPLQQLKNINDTTTRQITDVVKKMELLNGMATPVSPLDFYKTTTLLDDGSSSSSSDSSDNWLSSSTEAMISTTLATVYTTVSKRVKCYNITVRCTKPIRVGRGSTTTLTAATTTAMLLMNLSTTLQPPFGSTIETTTLDLNTTLNTPPPTFTLPTSFNLPSNTKPSIISTPSSIISTSSSIETTDTTESSSSSTTEKDTSTLSTPSSTSTTQSPGNDSFFDYADYFDGMSFEVLSETEASAQQPQTSSVRPRPTRRRPKRIPRQLAAATEQTLVPAWTSRYSRRRNSTVNSPEDVTTDYTTETSTNITSSTTTNTKAIIASSTISALTNFLTPTTLTTENLSPTTKKASTITEREFTTTERESTTPERESTTTEKEFTITTEAPTTPTSEPTPAETPVDFDTDELLKVLKFFKPLTTDEPTTTASTATIDDPMEYFINSADIQEIGTTEYYDDIDDSNFHLCVQLICKNVNDDGMESTTESPDDGINVSTTTLSPMDQHRANLTLLRSRLTEVQKNLTSMCWETSLGQELSKVIVFDGIMSIVAPLCMDFLRGLFVRYMNPHWCWDMEKSFPQYGDFKIAENILTLINNQGQVWMGIFFSPGLVIINLVKLMIMMYFRSWIVLTCNVPHEVVFKASKSNNFYLSLLLTMLFLCVLPVGYAIVWLRPSWHCGPFSEYNRISDFITHTIRNALPKELHGPLEYLTSASTVIPLLLLLVLIIYYLVSLTSALREANQDLRTQLQKEREEERKKFFKKPEEKPSEGGSITNRWRKVLDASSPVTPTSQPPDFDNDEYKNQARKELISRIMKKALRKGSATSDDDSLPRRDDDDTDNEHNDSLPLDEDGKRPPLSRLQQIRRTRKPSLVDMVAIAKRSPTTPTGADGSKTPAVVKSRFRIERLEQKSSDDKSGGKSGSEPLTPATPITPENEHDPDTNSRIVNERRQSLLRRKREEDEEKRRKDEQEHKEPKSAGHKEHHKERKEHEKPKDKKEHKEHKEQDRKEPKTPKNKTDTGGKKSPTSPPVGPVANFEVVNEKKHTTEATTTSQSESSGMFRFKKSKVKPQTANGAAAVTAPISHHAAEPEVFKFDEKTVEKSHAKLGKPVGIPTVPSANAETPSSAAAISSSSPSPSPSPTLTATLQRHANPEKLFNLSRQGRKKIGNFFALMRDTVKKGDDDTSSSPEPPSPTPMPSIKPHLIVATAAAATATAANTAIDMPHVTSSMHDETQSTAAPPPYTSTYQRVDCPAPSLPPELQAIAISIEPPIAETPITERPTPTITITAGSEEHLPSIHGQSPQSSPLATPTTTATNQRTSASGDTTPIIQASPSNTHIVKINVENERH